LRQGQDHVVGTVGPLHRNRCNGPDRDRA